MDKTLRKEFLALARRVKRTGIADKLSVVSGPKQLKKIWNEFFPEDSQLVKDIKNWGKAFHDKKSEAIFKSYDKPKNVFEIAVCIIIIGDENVNEESIFGATYERLSDMLLCEENPIAQLIGAATEIDHWLSEFKSMGQDLDICEYLFTYAEETAE